MASWRDAFDADTQNDLDRVFLSAPGYAASQLEAGQRFAPYAAHMDLEGSVGLMAADPSAGDDPTKIVSSLSEVLNLHNDQIRASAIVSDAGIGGAGGGAISVHLEHRTGASIRVLIPYTTVQGGAVVHEPSGVEPVPAVVFG